MKHLDELVRNVDPNDFLLTKEGWRRYAMQRLAWIKPDGTLTSEAEIMGTIAKIVLHNGSLGSEISEAYPHAEPIRLNLAREVVLIDRDQSTLHIAQPASQARAERFEDMIYTGCTLANPDWNVAFESLNLGNDRQRTLRKYGDRAYDFIRDVSLSHDKLHDIHVVTIGPLDWFKEFSDAQIIEDQSTEYLGYVIAMIGNQRVLCLDYCYSDQMKHIVDNLLTTYDGETERHELRDVHILIYGKVGGIRPPQRVNDIVLPNGIISSDNKPGVARSRWLFTDLDNAMRERADEYDYILHASSIPLQRRSELIGGQRKGCSIVEMECHYATQVINMARTACKNLSIHQGFVGFISDTPMDGITLADNPDQIPGRKKTVELVVDYIRQH